MPDCSLVRHAPPQFLTAAAVALALLAGACHRPAPEEKAAQDARDVAQVEAMQKLHPPALPVRPQPVNEGVRDLFNLARAGCEFLPNQREVDQPVLVAGKAKAVLMLNEQPVIFAADSGSGELHAGVHAKYVGRTHWAALTMGPGDGKPVEGGRMWPASLAIHDRFERVVYFAAGALTCHG